MQLNKKKLAQGAITIGFGAVLNLTPVPNRVTAVVVAGIEIAIALIESVKKESVECGDEDKR